jgi:hypothetical protein
MSEEVIIMLLVPNICFHKSKNLHYITFIEKKWIPPKFRCIIILIQCFLLWQVFSFWWLRKTVKQEYFVKHSLLSEKTPQLFQKEIILRNYLLDSTGFFSWEQIFCLFSRVCSVFYKTIPGFFEFFFSIWNLFLET